MPRTKKVTSKPKVKLETAQSATPVASQEESSKAASLVEHAKKYRVALAALFFIGALAVAATVLYRSYLVAAYVNGEQISRLEVIKQLEKANGKAALKQIITTKLIKQEAKKKNIEVNQGDIDKEIKTIETSLAQQGTTLDAALQSEGLTRAELTKQMETQILLRKMVKTVAVTDAELAAYITANEAQLPPVEERDENFSTQIKQQMVQQKEQEAIQKFLAELESKADVKSVFAY